MDKLKRFWDVLNEFFKKPNVKTTIIVFTYTLLVATVSVSTYKNVLTYRVNKVMDEVYQSEVEAGKKPVDIEPKKNINVNDKYNINAYGCVYNKKITPSSEGYNSYFANTTDGNIYLDTIVDFENKSGRDVVLADIVSASVEHGANNYTAICTVEINNHTGFEYAAEYTVKNGDKIRIHFISDIPAFLEKDTTPTYAIVSVDNRLYKLLAVE